MRYSFYILYSEILERYYYGHTSDTPERRLANHLSKHRGYTGKAKDWRVVHREEFASKSEAYAREREVKSLKNRGKVELLISGN